MFSDKDWTECRHSRHKRAVLLLPLFLSTLLATPAVLAGNIGAIEIGEDQVTVRFDDLVAGASTLLLAGPGRNWQSATRSA